MTAKPDLYDKSRVPLWEYVPLDTPFLIKLEPTFACNFRCEYCIHSKPVEVLEETYGRMARSMPWETFLLFLEQAKQFPHKVRKITIDGFGEPLLNPRLPEMIRMIRSADVCDIISLTSNASLLTPAVSEALAESGLTQLRISLQGMTSEKYRQVCGVPVDMDRMYENIRYFYQHRGTINLGIKIADVALAPGEDQLFFETFGEICDNIAVEHITSFFQGVDYDRFLEKSDNKYGLDLHSGICVMLFYKMTVFQDGTISFGCLDTMSYEGFNMHNMTLRDAWESKEHRTLLYDHLTHRMERHPGCVGCEKWDWLLTSEADILDGHEEQILARLNAKEWDFSGEVLRPEIMLCGQD